MIIAFDGNVFSGKTSLIRAFISLRNSNIVDEHSVFLKTDISAHSVTATEAAILLQSKYLDAEHERCSRLDIDRLNLLDRSFVSLAAHVYASNSVYGIDIREWFLKEICERIKFNKVIIPDVFCFVRCRHRTIRERFLENRSRNTARIYCTEKYLYAIEYFNQSWLEKIRGIIIDTEVDIPVGLAKTLIQQIPMSSQGQPSTSQICTYLQDILMQTGTQ